MDTIDAVEVAEVQQTRQTKLFKLESGALQVAITIDHAVLAATMVVPDAAPKSMGIYMKYLLRRALHISLFYTLI